MKKLSMSSMKPSIRSTKGMFILLLNVINLWFIGPFDRFRDPKVVELVETPKL